MPSEEPSESLAESFRQSRREMFVMLAAWTVFFIWSGVTCTVLSRQQPAGGESVPMLFGIPKWAALGIVIPWMAANAFTIWFAGFFMKDTELGPSEEASNEQA